MPIYEYKCDDCGSAFEKLVRRSGEDVSCPSCGQNHLSLQLSTFAAHANGTPARNTAAPMCPGGMCGNPGVCGRN